MKQGKIIILSGPSGAGKTTIHEQVLKSKRLRGKVVRSISMTTRDRRPGERNGRDYFFITSRMFAYKIKAGHFLEWAKVFDHYYGTPLKNVRDLVRSGKSVVLCIDVQGAQCVMEKCPAARSIFIKTPAVFDLKKRLLKRATEGTRDLTTRLRRARKEIQEEKKYNATVINDRLQDAVRSVEELIAQWIAE